MSDKELLFKDLCARLPQEEWRIVPEYPGYAVSNKGNIATLKTGKLRKFSDHKGYKQCMLRKDGKAYNRFVHRLVASAFLPTPQEGQVIDHINGVRNDNRVENLRWCSLDENLHFPLAKKHREHLCKVCSQYNLDGTYVATYKSSFEAEKTTGIKCGSINNCCKGKQLSCGGFQWKYGESTESIPPIRQSLRRICVAKCDEQGNFIASYSSCREAARENNLNFQVISECINGKRKNILWRVYMEKINRELLIIDICSRLPYGVFVKFRQYTKPLLISIKDALTVSNEGEILDNIQYLYLRPMSSMTEEEYKEYTSIDNRSYSCPMDYAHIPASERIDWLNKNMFDYRGLIEKKLALDCTGLHIY